MTAGAGAIVVAAGSGVRFGSTEPKAFVLLAGLPLVAHSLAIFETLADIREVVVVLREEDVLLYLADVADRCGFQKVARVVPGGARRQDSVRMGLAALSDSCDVVLVHDAARPFVSAALVTRCFAALDAETTGVIPTLPIVDTLKEVSGNRVVGTVDRSPLVRVQTPQVFRRGALARAHAHAEAAALEATDDATLVEAAGGIVRCVEGDPMNIKITYAADLVVAEALLRARRGATEAHALG